MAKETSFFEIFEKLEDPRDNRGKLYPLIDIILLALYGVLSGFEDFTNMSHYLKKEKPNLRKNSDYWEESPPMMYFLLFSESLM